ncbi:hypothetical protein HPG69_004753, partial [Diceros bicornis minor]
MKRPKQNNEWSKQKSKQRNTWGEQIEARDAKEIATLIYEKLENLQSHGKRNK